MAHHPPDSSVTLLCVLLSLFKWVWQWQPVHHKLSINVALRKFCCQALCSSVSVTGYCVVICVPIFGVCQCCKSASMSAEVVCTNVFEWSSNICVLLLLIEKKNVAPILPALLQPVACHVSQNEQMKSNGNVALSRSHLSALLHCLHQFSSFLGEGHICLYCDRQLQVQTGNGEKETCSKGPNPQPRMAAPVGGGGRICAPTSELVALIVFQVSNKIKSTRNNKKSHLQENVIFPGSETWNCSVSLVNDNKLNVPI